MRKHYELYLNCSIELTGTQRTIANYIYHKVGKCKIEIRCVETGQKWFIRNYYDYNDFLEREMI